MLISCLPIGGSGIDYSLAIGEYHRQLVRISRGDGKIMFSGDSSLLSEAGVWTKCTTDLICYRNSSVVCKTNAVQLPYR